MMRKEFIKLIDSIGFRRYYLDIYEYGKKCISLYDNYYRFYNGYYWIDDISYNDLTPILKITRSAKLKKILE